MDVLLIRQQQQAVSVIDKQPIPIPIRNHELVPSRLWTSTDCQFGHGLGTERYVLFIRVCIYTHVVFFPLIHTKMGDPCVIC